MRITLKQVHVQPSPNGMLVQVQGIDTAGNSVVYSHTMPMPKLGLEDPRALVDAVKLAVLTPTNGDPS